MESGSGVSGVAEINKSCERSVGVEGVVGPNGLGGARVGVEGVDGVSESAPSASSMLVERTARERWVFERTRRGREGELVSADSARVDGELGSGCPGVPNEGREEARKN
eukprot:Phypoly_transcript_08698.p1 GENE.Phypoly_transcript_08698~~Phypoly_transcript_08698.p1  ORF type:complete len:109 (-),score=12.61 Phypoly_transcript_08698:684-1010(-)